MGVYEELGVKTIINASGYMTRLSGSCMNPEVVEAMAEASRSFVKMEDLQEAAGRVIAEITGAEAGYVAPGAAACLTLASAACICGMDPSKMNRLPDAEGMKNQIIIHRAHRSDYDHAFRASGARLVEVGFPYSFGTFPYELEAAINDRTAAVAYHAGGLPEALSLPEVVEIAHGHGVPVIVDAAAELPPASNLQRFVAEGADLVAFSGGKAIRGPQASGFLCGQADLIRSVAMQHQDMSVNPQTWPYRSWMEGGLISGPPHHGIGRGLKVGKEEIVGLVAALRRYVKRDHDADRADWRRKVDHVVGSLADLPGIEARVRVASPNKPVPLAWIAVDQDALKKTVFDVILAMQADDPPICLDEDNAHIGVVAVNPMNLRDGEEQIVADRLRAALS